MTPVRLNSVHKPNLRVIEPMMGQIVVLKFSSTNWVNSLRMINTPVDVYCWSTALYILLNATTLQMKCLSLSRLPEQKKTQPTDPHKNSENAWYKLPLQTFIFG